MVVVVAVISSTIKYALGNAYNISSSGEIQGLSPSIKRSLRRVFEHLPK